MRDIANAVRVTGSLGLLIGGLAVAGAPTASATQTSTSCVGSLVGYTALKGGTSGTVLGYLNVYWDSSTGQNCATTTSSSSTYGTAKSMTVEIWECVTDTVGASCAGIPNTGAHDYGTFKYYAGPVSAPGRGHCVEAYGQVIMPSGDLAEYDSGTRYC